MNKKINFLREKVSGLKQKATQLFIIQIISFSLLIIYGLGVVAVFAYFFILEKENGVLIERINQQKTAIQSFQSVETKAVYLKNKLKSLDEVLTSQRANQKITDAVFNLLPEGITISGFAIDQDGGVSFSAQSQSLKDLKNFLANLELSKKVNEMMVKKIKIGGVNFDYEKGYSFNIYLLFEDLDNG